jgi:hypothetical protein
MRNLKHTVKIKCENDDLDEMLVSKSFQMSARDLLESVENQGFDPCDMLEDEGILCFIGTDDDDDDRDIWEIRTDRIVSGVCSIIEEQIKELICNGFLYENFDVDNSSDASVDSIEFEDEDPVIIEEFTNAIVSIFSDENRNIIIV